MALNAGGWRGGGCGCLHGHMVVAVSAKK